MSEEKILAWHFTEGATLRGGQPLEVGKTYTYRGDVEICKSGYHASRRLIDALRYAPGAQISRVECWGDVQEQNDKLVARNRTVLWTLDATMVLHEFACRVAEIALSKVTPDPRSLAAIKAKRKWMKGKISDEELDAAGRGAWYATESAAESAAWYAAKSAAESAARSVAGSATGSAAWYAAWYAARSAALSAAWSAALSAAWSAALSVAGSAALSAAWYAAWYAAGSDAWSHFDKLLTQMVEALPVKNAGIRRPPNE